MKNNKWPGHLNKLSSPIPWRFHMKFGFNWPSGFREDIWTHTHSLTREPSALNKLYMYSCTPEHNNCELFQMKTYRSGGGGGIGDGRQKCSSVGILCSNGIFLEWNLWSREKISSGEDTVLYSGKTHGYFSQLFKREIKTLAHLRHCQDSSEVKSRHLSPAMSPLFAAPTGLGFQMTGA